MKRLVVALAIAGGAYLALHGFGACATDDHGAATPVDAGTEHQPYETGSDAPKDVASEYEIPPWDPVWHKTTPATFEVVPPGPRLKVACGARCTVISSVEPEGIASRRPRANDDWVVFQVAPGRIHAIDRNTGVEHLVDDGSEWPTGKGAGGGPSLFGARAFYAVGLEGRSVMVVRDLLTGETKQVWTAEKTTGGGTSTTACAAPYLFWSQGPPDRFYRFNMNTGELKSVDGGGEFIMEGSSTGFATAAGEGWIDVIDFDKGQRTALGKDGQGAVLGGISPDGKQAAWIDLRHPGPNGEKSTWLEPLAGGEAYLYDVASKAETRLTFDSPANPSFKTMARVVGDTVVWHSWSGGQPRLPTSGLAFEGMSAVWFVKAGGAPTPLRDPADLFGWAQPVSSGVVALSVHELEGGFNEALLVHVAWPPEADGGDGG